MHTRNKTAGVTIVALLGLLALASTASAAENLLANGDAETGDLNNWRRFTEVSEDAHSGKYAFKAEGQHVVTNKKPIPIDPAKTYTLSVWLKSAGPDTSLTYLGFQPLDAKRQRIHAQEVNVIPNTETELVEACKKTDTVLKVKDASGWGDHKFGYVAFDIDPSDEKSDLPNRNLSARGIERHVNKGDHWEIHLTESCGVSYPAGTKVRQHKSGGTYMYTIAARETVPTEWKQFSGEIEKDQPYKYSHQAWWPGTKYVRVMLYMNAKTKGKKTTLVDDVVLTATE